VPESGYDIPTVQELPGHKDIKTTMVYYTRVGRLMERVNA
jgi:integrase